MAIRIGYEMTQVLGACLPRCGECSKWMKSKQCPREHNVKGMSRGPSSGEAACDEFEAKSADVAARVAQRWEPAQSYINGLVKKSET